MQEWPPVPIMLTDPSLPAHLPRAPVMAGNTVPQPLGPCLPVHLGLGDGREADHPLHTHTLSLFLSGHSYHEQRREKGDYFLVMNAAF